MGRGRNTSFPSRIVSLAVHSTTSKGAAPGIAVSRCDAVVSRHSRIEAGKNGRIKTFTGSSGEEWVVWLKARLRHEGVTWVVAHRMGDLLRQMGFFSLIDAGTLRLSPPGEAELIRHLPHKKVRPTDPLVLAADLPTAIKVFTDQNQKLILCDLRNWIDCDLDQLAESLEVKRLTSTSDVGVKIDFHAALIRDLEIQEKAFLAYLAWCKSRGMQEFRLTAGAQSLVYYKMRHRKVTPSDDAEPEVRKLERDGLWGGKVVARYVGHCQVKKGGGIVLAPNPAAPSSEVTPRELYHLDVTGLYASLMETRLFPHRLVEWSDVPAEPDHGPPHYGLDLVASVLIQTKHDTYPVKDGRRTLWATGSIWTVLSGPELQRAIRTGCVRSWGVYARYDLADLFSSYIAEIWQLREHARKTGSKMMGRVAKAFINSLWGKFASKQPQWNEADDPGFGERWGVFAHVDAIEGSITWYRALAGVYQVQSKPTDTPDSYPAIAGWLTSYGRVMLDDLIRVAGDRETLYLAVDALVTTELGFLNLAEAGQVEPHRLGKLRVTGRHRLGKFGGYNRYWLDGCAHVSGLKSDAREIRDGVYVQRDGGKLVPALLAGERDGLVSVNRTIDFSRNIVYGKVARSGWVTPPEIIQVPF